MKIYRFEEFVSEGILSGLFSSIMGKKSKLDSILNKIKESRMDFVKESGKIKKEIFDLYKSGEESSFEVEMLKKSLSNYQLAKNREAENLKKEAYEIIGNKSDLLSHFQSKLAKIEIEAAEETLKKSKGYESDETLRKLTSDLERMTAIADKKMKDDSSIYSLPDSSPIDVDPEVERVLSMSTGEFESHIQSISTRELDSLERSLKKYTWSLQKLMDNATLNLRKQLTRARKEDDVYAESVIRKEIREIESSYRKEHKDTRDKIYRVEKVSKRKYAAQEN